MATRQRRVVGVLALERDVLGAVLIDIAHQWVGAGLEQRSRHLGHARHGSHHQWRGAIGRFGVGIGAGQQQSRNDARVALVRGVVQRRPISRRHVQRGSALQQHLDAGLTAAPRSQHQRRLVAQITRVDFGPRAQQQVGHRRVFFPDREHQQGIALGVGEVGVCPLDQILGDRR